MAIEIAPVPVQEDRNVAVSVSVVFKESELKKWKSNGEIIVKIAQGVKNHLLDNPARIYNSIDSL